MCALKKLNNNISKGSMSKKMKYYTVKRLQIISQELKQKMHEQGDE
jgi:hypothetical protein